MKRMNERWVCIGHSHVAALAQAGGKALDSINFWDDGDLWFHIDGLRPLREDYVERVAKAKVVISAIGGSAHGVMGTIEHEQPFDFVLPSDPDLPFDKTRELIPVEAVRQTMADLAAPLLRGLPILAEAVTGSLIHLAPPPPSAVIKFVKPPADVGEVFMIGKAGAFTPKWPRYKMWRLHCEIIEDFCAQHGVKYLAAPSRANDDEGFLRSEYIIDTTHGNADYARLVLEDVRRAL
jgi:hypothetical protein